MVMTDNNELKQGVEQAIEQRATQVLNADPQWQRLRGMLDVLEGKVNITKQENNNEVLEGQVEGEDS
jgi:phage shock protein A